MLAPGIRANVLECLSTSQIFSWCDRFEQSSCKINITLFSPFPLAFLVVISSGYCVISYRSIKKWPCDLSENFVFALFSQLQKCIYCCCVASQYFWCFSICDPMRPPFAPSTAHPFTLQSLIQRDSWQCSHPVAQLLSSLGIAPLNLPDSRVSWIVIATDV